MGTTLPKMLPEGVQYLVQTEAALVAAVLLLGLVCLVFVHRDGRAYGTRSRPDLFTVPGLPLFGNVFQVVKNGERGLEMFVAMRKSNPDKSKVMSLTAPGRRIIDISRPSWIEYVQKTNFQNFHKGPKVYENMHGVLGDGIFVVDGESWKSQRKATSKIFNTKNFRGFITTSIVSEIDKLKAIVGRHADKGEQFDLADLFFRFTLESFSNMAFGRNVGALSQETDAPVPFASAFDYAQGVMASRFMNPAWKLSERINGVGKKMAEATKVIDAFAYNIITQREKDGLGNITQTDKKDAGAKDLLSLYMALRDENGQPLSKKALRDSVLNLIIAGRDTTAQALAWTWFHLLTRPELMAPLRDEVDACKTVDFDSYKSLVQVQAVFHEGLRLHPSVPRNAWRVKEDDKIPDGGPMLHAGDTVVWSDFEMGRFTEVWGPDAGEFKPSRWIEGGELKKESQWKAHFFNGGARLCLGQTLAIYEATAVLSALIRDFDLKAAPGYLETVEMVDFERTPRYANSLSLPMKAPLLVTATRRTLL